MKTNDFGYTLIEVMVALAVFAIIASLSASIMYHTFDVRERVAAQANQLNELQLALSLVEHDVAQFIPRTVRAQDTHLFLAFTGVHTYMEFTRGGITNPTGIARKSGLKRVAYACKNGQLIRRTWSVLDTIGRRQSEDKILLSQLGECSFSYVSLYHEILPEWRAFQPEQSKKLEAIPSAIEFILDPKGLGEMTFIFILPEGLYAA